MEEFTSMGTLLVVFVILKLTGEIGWPWIWVLSPLWMGAAFLLAVLIVLVVMAAIARW